jgi:ribonuclease Y
MCSPTSVETKIIQVAVPKDEIKGRLVGKEGKNIHEFERLLEVDIIFNDLPNTISIAGYNLINRRIAQKAIEQLMREKRLITPQLLEETIKQAGKEIDKELYEIGEKVMKMMDLKNLDKELIKTIGRLQYRTSYGQNIMKHSLEVSWIATMLGSEVGLNVNVCKVAGFLHDLGKAIDQDPNVQGTHDFLTKELMTKYNFTEEEIHAAWTHHDSAPAKTPEALIVKAADAVSAGRPGARQESMEKYTERIMALEDAGRSFTGVKKAYAISAGRELRIFVDPEQVTDENMKPLAEEIANKIEKEISYPGKIKINTIRRTGFTEVAK